MDYVTLRVTKDSGLNFLKPHLLPDRDVKKDVLIAFYKNQIHDLDFIFINSTFSLDPMEIKGFLLAQAPPLMNYVWIQQAWTDPHLPKEEKANAFQQLKDWVKEIGRNEIRFETERAVRGFEKWGFSPMSQILSMKTET